MGTTNITLTAALTASLGRRLHRASKKRFLRDDGTHAFRNNTDNRRTGLFQTDLDTYPERIELIRHSSRPLVRTVGGEIYWWIEKLYNTMSENATAGSLPSLVASLLAMASVVVAATASDYFGTGIIGAVPLTLVLMLVFARAYEALTSSDS
jgi:hypothetical protein